MTDELEFKILSAVAAYPAQWKRVIADWCASDGEDAAWLTYTANYLLRTAGLHWAVDPFSLFTRVGRGEQPDFLRDLECLQLVVLTHAHNDHLDRNLLREIAPLPLTWVIPGFMLDQVRESVNLPEDRLIIPTPGKLLRIGNLALTPFDGLHFNKGAGIAAMGYLAEFNGKRWLFPGDTRSYEPQRLPDFRPLNGIFTHLWLGKGCALHNQPPLMEEFIRFCTWQSPKRIILTHLDELGRSLDELWNKHHACKVMNAMHTDYPNQDVAFACTGDKVLL